MQKAYAKRTSGDVYEVGYEHSVAADRNVSGAYLNRLVECDCGCTCTPTSSEEVTDDDTTTETPPCPSPTSN